MMIDTEFRGKRTDGKGWVEGDLCTKDIHHGTSILKDGVITYAVNPDTVGQYTWLQDKNGTKVYAGDIFEDGKGVIRTIFQVPGGFACEENPQAFGYNSYCSPVMGLSDAQNASWFENTCIIIGNIHDNAEILKR